jgi:integrase
MSKRGHGEGTITLRKDGRWEARLSLDGGKRRTFYGKSRREVQQKLNKSRRDLQDGLPIVPERQTVSAYLSPWLEAARPTVRAKTYETYDLNVRRVLPYLGHKKLATLTAADVQACYAALLERGRTRQVKSDQAPKGLSRRSVRQIHEMLHRALKQAAEWGMIARNPADTAKPPRPGREEMKTLSQTQVQQLFTMTAQDRLHALWVLLITTGLRWQDVDLRAGTLTVQRALQRRRNGGLVFVEPKSAHSRRTVHLADETLAELQAHHDR